MSDAARLIREARRAAALTQAELAELVGVSQSAIAKLERTGANPTVQTLDRVLRATGHQLQLIAPVWGTVDPHQIDRALALSPGERVIEGQELYNATRRVAAAVEPSRTPELHAGRLLRRLAEGGVDFVVIGAIAVAVHGCVPATKDLDIAYATDAANLERLGGVLVDARATLRGIDEAVAFVPDARTLARTRLLTLDTSDGGLDLLAEPPGAPPYPELVARALPITVHDVPVRIASVDDLIAMKREADRPQDLVDLEALEVVRRKLRRR